MKYYYPIFGLFLIFVLWQAYERGKSTRIFKQKSDDFWKRESDSNSVRKKNLDTLTYTKVNEKILLENLWSSHPEDETLAECSNTLQSLMNERILNLTGKTSTDIKLEYGVANLNDVSLYDDNFTTLIKTVVQYGDRLVELNNKSAAITVYEFGIDSLSDISSNYKSLASLYIEMGTPEKIDHLIDVAQSLNSMMKDSIIKSLIELREQSKSAD